MQFSKTLIATAAGLINFGVVSASPAPVPAAAAPSWTVNIYRDSQCQTGQIYGFTSSGNSGCINTNNNGSGTNVYFTGTGQIVLYTDDSCKNILDNYPAQNQCRVRGVAIRSYYVISS